MFKNTEEQDHILSLVSRTGDNLIINALAGCGKTSTLEMIEKVVPQKPILYLVFNKRNKDEAVEKMLGTTTVSTLNGMGHKVWGATIGKRLIVDDKKTRKIFQSIVEAAPKTVQSELWACYGETVSGVRLAKALGYIPLDRYPKTVPLTTKQELHNALEEKPDDLVSDLIDAVLAESIKASFAGTVDFDDQIYMPALFRATFPRYPFIMVDEAQDLSPTNHALLKKLAKDRLIAVGDPWQNIYGFRGAKAAGMAELGHSYSCTQTSLSVSFRCPQAIVENARWRVPHFKWIKPGGTVENLVGVSFHNIPDGATVICRNNAPLFRMAMLLLTKGRSVTVHGSDIGPRLIGIMEKFGDPDMKQSAVIIEIDQWLEEKLAKESKTALDMADCMKVFAGFGKTLGEAISYAKHLFAQQGTISLMTGHKSKGLEFDHVIHLDPHLLGDDEQDKNLRYVIQTRSKNYYGELLSTQVSG